MDLSELPKGVIAPVVAVTQATGIVSGNSYTVRDIVRYNPPPINRFACNCTRNSDALPSLLNVWTEDVGATWKCGEYKPTRYRDEDGVNKGL